MWQRIGLGAAVGLVVAIMSWRGNQTAGLVSTFPDAVTFVVLALLLAAAVHFDSRRSHPQDRAAWLRMGLTIAAASGLVFGSAIIWLGIVRFSSPSPGLLAFGFLTALGSTMACGAIAAVFQSGVPNRRAAQPAAAADERRDDRGE